jgi:uncharacterized membrane-anchored protein
MTTSTLTPDAALRRPDLAAVKVPAATFAFWVTKILTTGMGESTSDYLAKHLGSYPAVTLAGALLVAVLAVQLLLRRYVAGVYWAAVVLVSVFGTMAADVLHVGLGVPYADSTTAFAVLLAAVLTAWWLTERTLSVHSVRTRRREGFYWATVMATFALGTAVGDLTASTLHLGYLISGAAFAALFLLPGAAYRWLRLGAVPAFWAAYIVTRPLGASFADWMAASHRHGGLGLGTGPVSLGLTLAIAVCVGLLALLRGGPRAGGAAGQVQG